MSKRSELGRKEFSYKKKGQVCTCSSVLGQWRDIHYNLRCIHANMAIWDLSRFNRTWIKFKQVTLMVVPSSPDITRNDFEVIPKWCREWYRTRQVQDTQAMGTMLSPLFHSSFSREDGGFGQAKTVSLCAMHANRLTRMRSFFQIVEIPDSLFLHVRGHRWLDQGQSSAAPVYCLRIPVENELCLLDLFSFTVVGRVVAYQREPKRNGRVYNFPFVNFSPLSNHHQMDWIKMSREPYFLTFWTLAPHCHLYSIKWYHSVIICQQKHIFILIKAYT